MIGSGRVQKINVVSKNNALMLVARQASLNPARALGLPAGDLIPGAAADLVVLDQDLSVTGVFRRGVWELEPGA